MQTAPMLIILGNNMYLFHKTDTQYTTPKKYSYQLYPIYEAHEELRKVPHTL